MALLLPTNPKHRVLGYQGELDLYKVALAEAITSQTEAAIEDGDQVKFPVYATVMNRVLRFTQHLTYLVNLHVALQQIGKGVCFKFGDSAIPVPQLTRSTSQALSLFDRRVASFDQRPLSLLGTEGHEKASIEKLDRVFVQIVRRKETTWVPGRAEVAEHELRILSNYGFQYFDLGKLSRLTADKPSYAPIHSSDAGALLIILRVAAALLNETRFSRPVLEVGYVPMYRSTLLNICASRFEDARASAQATVPGLDCPETPEYLVQTLEGMSGSLWPVRPGPVIRSCAGTSYVDLAAATLRLDEAFTFPTVTGEQANLRAEHFEESVQAIIDRSAWSDSFLRVLRGRPLRHHGETMTDIDAIGAHKGRLLLVSCKSVLYA
jgi:hypothetical protein